LTWDGKLFARQLATRRVGRELRHLEQIDSTNSWLLIHHGEFNLTGGVVVADHQTNGRGRNERSWLDIPGRSLLFSLILRLKLEQEGVELLSLLPGIALAQSLRALLPEQIAVALKWPNDVQLNARKVAGVLGQSTVQAGRRIVVIGVGCNVSYPRAEMPAEFRAAATSILDEAGTDLRREMLLAEFLNRIEPVFDLWSEREFAAIRGEWERFGPQRGLVLTRHEGNDELSGAYEGLGERGQLRLLAPDGNVHEVFSGDVLE
jgi:BirA family transcriptional regulator, biotin operon repressor / biotin---[acetyl-CoA-carboxylase] ligase